MDDPASPGGALLALWRRLRPYPGGAWLFSRLLGRRVPYTGSLGATVLELEPGRARVALMDRRAVRNHLGSVHAVALANLGELTSGLAVLTSLSGDGRGIVTRLSVDFLKKARGRLVALCETEVAPLLASREHEARAHIVDEAGDEVAVVTATWLLSPRPEGARTASGRG